MMDRTSSGVGCFWCHGCLSWQGCRCRPWLDQAREGKSAKPEASYVFGREGNWICRWPPWPIGLGFPCQLPAWWLKWGSKSSIMKSWRYRSC